jgi:hypothetical protein
MKKIAASLLLSLFLFLTVAPVVAAQDITSDFCKQVNNATASCRDAQAVKSGNNPLFGPTGAVTTGVKIFLAVVGITAVFVILVNAVRMITADGDASKVNSARNGLIYAAIGLAIAASAQLIVTTILSNI